MPTPDTDPAPPADRPPMVGAQPGVISGQFDGLLAALFTLAAWTAAPIFIKFFVADIDLWTSNGWRYAFAALCWLPLVVCMVAMKRLPAGIWKKAMIPAVFNSLGQVCFVAALYLIAAGIVTFGLRAHIVFVAIGAAILFPQERALIRKPAFLLAGATVLLGVCGVLLLGDAATATPAHTGTIDTLPSARIDPHPGVDSSEEPAGSVSGFITPVGIALSILAGLFFACYGLSIRKCMSGIGPMASFGVVSLYTAGTMIALMLLFADRHGAGAVTDLNPTQFILLLASAIIPIALAHVAYYHAISKLGVATVSGIVQLQPFTVSAVGFILFAEALTPGQLLAGMVAIGGAIAMLLVQRGHAKVERAQREAAGEAGG